MKKILLITLGSLSLLLGIIGIVLPVLPTTPFLLLSGACYVRSSNRLYDWLINHRVLGIYIGSYLKYKAIPLRSKIVALIMLWSVMLTTMIFFIDKNSLRVLLSTIAIAVTIHIIRIKTLDLD